MVKKQAKSQTESKKTVKKVKKENVEVNLSVSEPAAAEEPKPEVPVVQEAASEECSENSLSKVIEDVQSAFSMQKSILNNVKAFSKLYKKELKDLKKMQRKSKRANKKDPHRQKRAPSGFAVPSQISSEMCSFLGIPEGTQLSRTDVTRKLTAYIREKNLQRKENRRSFDPDVQLGAILGPLKSMDVDKGYTYFNLQRYITPHIVSNSAAAKN